MSEEQAASNPEKRVFEVQRIYIVDASFESPKAPAIFTEQIEPSTNVDLNSNSRKLADGIYEVVLNVTVTMKHKEDVAYLAEVKQGGVFAINGYGDDEIGHLLGSQCPSIIYPYTREAICDLVVKGGFPQLHLSPINFDALYAHHVREQQKAQSEKDDAVKH